jgi:ABC-type multidrug transport system fused ATPase/permease subunit
VWRGVVVAVVAAGERLFAPLLVYEVIVQRRAWAILLGLALSTAFAARTALQAGFVAWVEVQLYQRVVGSVLAGDVLRPSVVPDEDARAGVFEGMHRSARLLVEVLPNLAANALAATVLAILVALTQPARVTLVAGAALGVGGLFLVASRGWVGRAQERAWSGWLLVVDMVTDAIDGRLDLVAAGREDDFKRRFASLAGAWFALANRAARIAGAAGRTPLLALVLGVGLVVLFDAQARGVPWKETVERAALLASYAPAFVGLAHGLPELVRGEQRLRLLTEIVRAEPMAATASRAQSVPLEVAERVQWNDVRFCYDGAPAREALRGVSFAWRSGQTLALVGANGSGKSTCIRALLGLGKTTGGCVLVDGTSVADLDLVGWRRRVSFLPQRPYLAPRMTVRECLRFVDDVSDEGMLENLRRVELLELLRRLSNDPLEIRVGTLSVGQRQRVALARVLGRHAPLLVLDEPDANLDRAGTALVAGLIKGMARERMVLVVAHSEELLAAADRVVTLDDGLVLSDVSRGVPRAQAG